MTHTLDEIDILAEACDRIERKDLDAVDTLLHAIFYLRAGCYPFNRKAKQDAA